MIFDRLIDGGELLVAKALSGGSLEVPGDAAVQP